MELGVAYLWVQDYQAAWEHFDSANQRYPKHADVFYGMAGAAKWCSNDPQESVRQSAAGLECQYADAAGGVRLPLLLFFASVVRPQVFDRTEAETLLAILREGSLRARNSPGALAGLVLGGIDAGDFRDRCVGRNESDTLLRRWLTDFYVGVVEHERGSLGAFKEAMKKTATTVDDDFEVNKGHYLRKLWHPEFFIARHEAAGLGG